MIDHVTTNARLQCLRQELEARGLDGFVVAHTDEHNSEYTPSYAARLAWLTGFDGSAGLGAVLRERAAIFTDSRYTLQVRAQTDGSNYDYRDLTADCAGKWLEEVGVPGQVIGFDPWLHSEGWVEKTAARLQERGMTLVPTIGNPIDSIWTDQPAPPSDVVEPHDIAYAGESSEDKRRRLAADLEADAAVITALDSIAWLLNIRGRDVHCTPVVVAFAVLHKDARVDLYIQPEKVTDAVRQHLGGDISIRPKTDFLKGLSALSGRVVQVDKAGVSVAILNALKDAGAEVKKDVDPCVLPKARKNEVELSGTRAAHIRDGAAVTRFLAWLDQEAPKGGLDEIKVADRLQTFREDTGALRDLSFDTISGAGPNGAIVHYRVTSETNRPLKTGELYLVDSGAQYLDGTTDITRTIAIGDVGAEERDRFTRVLKGHIAIATARFPKGTSGGQLDVLARMPLWQIGLNYGHGTGHGVGSYLSVHEGPQRISPAGHVSLEAGMILSNEPGFYKADAFGIRIENLVVVTPSALAEDYFEFETITLAPIDRKAIDRTVLTEGEAAWLNSYHRRVREALTPHLDSETASWLAAATSEI